jgi:hypothetical protein
MNVFFHPLRPSSRCGDCLRPSYYCELCGDYYHADGATCFFVREPHPEASDLEAILLHEEAARLCSEPCAALSQEDAAACALEVSAGLGVVVVSVGGWALPTAQEVHAAYIREHRRRGRAA